MRPRPFALVSTDHGSIIVNVHDRHQDSLGNAYGVGHQLFASGSFDPEEVELIKQTLLNLRTSRGDDLIAIDCGANIGVMTLEMATLMQGWGSVVAFEAQERLFYALCGNIALANLFNARAFCVALGSDSGTLMVPKPNYMKSGSFGSLELRRRPATEYIGQSISYAERDLQATRLLSLDSAQLPRADFIKIDVEGMELEVLEGARTLLETYSPTLLIEWIKSGIEPIANFLTPLGYTVTQHGMNLLATK